MKSTWRKAVVAAAIGGVVAFSVMPASAGGLFGDGGLIRGDVGRIHNTVQKPLTPIVRGTVEAATAGGAAVGGYYGGPSGAVIGGAVGNGVGRQINNCFAGHC